MSRGARHGLSLLLLAAIAVTIWHFWRRAADDVLPPVPWMGATPTPPGSAPGGTLVDVPTPPPTPTLAPGIGSVDELVRNLAAELSKRPELAKWLAQEDLIRRFVVVVDQIATGKSPKKTIAFLEPEEDFSSVERDGRRYVDPRSYRRYDAVAAVVESLDVEGTARLYRELEPHVEAAWAELGYPDRDFEETLAQAIRALLSVPVIEGAVELDPRVTTHEYADNRLEELSPVKKQFLRMGPDNVRKVQAKLRDIAAALDLDVQG